MGALQGLDSALESFGCDARAEFVAAGFDGRRLQDGDLLISLPEVARLLEHCSKVTGCTHLPLYLSKQQDISFLGTFGLLLQTTATVGDLLREIAEYHQVHVQSDTWSLERSGSSLCLRFWIPSKDYTPDQLRLITELAMSQCYRVIETATGSINVMDRVAVHYGDPQIMKEYRRFFSVPVEFNSELDGLFFSAAVLSQPISRRDSALHDLVQQQIANSGVTSDDLSLEQEVRAIIRSLLPTGECTVERVARCFACDKRTLQRYLRKESNTTYQTLLDEVRFDLILHYLRNTSLSMTQLTYVTGFTDPSNFTRAFRKRFGLSPRQWRQEQGIERRLSWRRQSPASYTSR